MPPIPAMAEFELRAVQRPWVWKQQWRDLLFLHWRVPVRTIRPFVPATLQLDTHDDCAWVSAVAFNLETRRFGLVLRFPELNLRTYARMNGTPGIFFLSLHAKHRLGVALARRLTPLPYFHVPIRCTRTTDAFTVVSPNLTAECRLRRDQHEAQAGSLDEWLLERYVGFCIDRRCRLFQVAVSHSRWQLHAGILRLGPTTLKNPMDFNLAREPDLWHFSDGVTAYVGTFQRCA